MSIWLHERLHLMRDLDEQLNDFCFKHRSVGGRPNSPFDPFRNKPSVHALCTCRRLCTGKTSAAQVLIGMKNKNLELDIRGKLRASEKQSCQTLEIFLLSPKRDPAPFSTPSYCFHSLCPAVSLSVSLQRPPDLWG